MLFFLFSMGDQGPSGKQRVGGRYEWIASFVTRMYEKRGVGREMDEKKE